MSEEIQTTITLVDKFSPVADKIASKWGKIGDAVAKAKEKEEAQRQAITKTQMAIFKTLNPLVKLTSGIRASISVKSKEINAYQKARDEYDKNLAKYQKLDKAYKDNYANVSRNTKIHAKFITKLTEASDTLRKSKEEVMKLREGHGKLESAMLKVNNVGGKVVDVFKKIDKYIHPIVKAYLKVGKVALITYGKMLSIARGGLTRVLGVLGQRLIGISEGFGRIGRGGMQALGQAIKDLIRGGIEQLAKALKGLVKSGIDEFAKLETSMQKISNFMGGMEDSEMATFKNTFNDIAKNSVFSVDQIAKAFEELSSVGDLTADQLIKVGTVMEKLATASGGSLEATGKILQQTMNAFGATADEAQRYAEVLLKVSNDSALSMENLGDAMQLVSGQAHSLGFNIEETASILGFLSNQGMSASRAGTALNQVFTALLDPSQEAVDTMSQFGLDFFKDDGSLMEMTDIMNILNTQLAGLTDEERLGAIANIFGVRGSRAILAMMNNTDELNQTINNTSGELDNLDKQAESMGNTLAGNMQKAKNSVDLLQASFGEALAPAINDALIIFTTFINENEEFKAMMDQIAVAINSVMSKLLPVIEEILPSFVSLLTTLIPAIEILGDVLVFVFSMFKEGTPLFKALMKLFDLFVKVLDMVMPVLMQLFDIFASQIIPILVYLFEMFVEYVLPVLLEFFQMMTGFMPQVIEIIKVIADIIVALLPSIMMMAKLLMKVAVVIIKAVLPILLMFANIILENIDIIIVIISIINILIGALLLLSPVIEFIAQVFMKVLLPVINIIMKGISLFINLILDAILWVVDMVAKSAKWLGLDDTAKKMQGLKDDINEIRDNAEMGVTVGGEMPTMPDTPTGTTGTTETTGDSFSTGNTSPNEPLQGYGSSSNNVSIGEINIYLGSDQIEGSTPEELADLVANAVAQGVAQQLGRGIA